MPIPEVLFFSFKVNLASLLLSKEKKKKNIKTERP